jgi:hypothetical protein
MERPMRQCKQCDKLYQPSSGHLLCPPCRKKNNKKPCPNCGTPIKICSTFCSPCYNKLAPKISRPALSVKLFMRRARRRGKMGELTEQDLIDVWDLQAGKCVYTKVDLVLPTDKGRNNTIYTASLDRIDSSLPYEKGNIQFISIGANYLKGSMSHEDMIVLCKIISKAWRE